MLRCGTAALWHGCTGGGLVGRGGLRRAARRRAHPELTPAPTPQVREWIGGIGVENIGKRLVNSKEGKVEFDKPAMPLATLMHYGNLLVEEQENVKRVQLADEYMSGAALAGASGSSLPEGYRAR